MIGKRPGSLFIIGVCAALGLFVAAGTASAQNVAWDMVSSSAQNLTSYDTDAPTFTSLGDGFQKYTVGVTSDIPYALVDDSTNGYAADDLGIIDSSSDTDEFFGVVDTENGDNSGPVTATWVFDISGASRDVELSVDLAAMGDFETSDTFVWQYQIDSGTVETFLEAVCDDDGSQSYMMADGDVFDYNDPLVVDGVTLSNQFHTFTTPVGSGSELTVTLTAVANGGSEAYVARNLVVALGPEQREGIPTLSTVGIALMALLVLGAGVVLVRRLH